ncbi:hypothetical protein ScalyP_jg5498 [Parmales sp. scaly parma]|nr:hypothetical protein ScalyP_jg5498 [Parmales sp. scaly parma]
MLGIKQQVDNSLDGTATTPRVPLLLQGTAADQGLGTSTTTSTTTSRLPPPAFFPSVRTGLLRRLLRRLPSGSGPPSRVAGAAGEEGRTTL